MLIDTFLPDYDVSKKHSIKIDAPVGVVYNQIYHLDLSGSFPIRLLFKLRGLPSSALTLQGLEEMGFAKLGAVQNEEFLMGLIGRFWSINGDLQKIDANSFTSFNKAGYARAAWNFRTIEEGDGRTLLTTETRVQCTDEVSARRFRIYWSIVGPFSGWIRKEALRIVKRETELKRKELLSNT